MISKERIVDLAQSFLEGSTNYLIDVRVSSTNKILVFIENDVNVSIQDCIQLSKHIEHSLDREMEDFELEVSSPGIDQPFRNMRQYKKYCGKEVDVLLKNGEKMKGLLSKVEETSIEIEPSSSKKSVKKATSENNKDKNKNVFLLNDIKETRLHINFK
jgi:ribosome maturation factor RimP